MIFNLKKGKNKMKKDKMIKRAIKGGMSEAQAKKLLEETLSTFSDKNLPHALQYLGFISSSLAEEMSLDRM